MLAAGLVPGMLLPGAVYISQSLGGRAPLHIGDTTTGTAEVTKTGREKNRMTLYTECRNGSGKAVLSGEAVASPGKE